MQTAAEAAMAAIAAIREGSELPDKSPAKLTPKSPTCSSTAGSKCESCADQGWVIRDVPPGDPDFGKAVPCSCRSKDIAKASMRKLEQIDGLTPEERRYTFEAMTVPPGSSTEQAVNACRSLIAYGSGIVTLTGPYGVGKTRTLISAINAAKAQGTPAVYTTMKDLLQYLREAFSPKAEETYLERWETLRSAPVLALDELDKVNSTPWALEQFSALVDHRWRNMRTMATLFALNTDVEALPGDVADRVTDGRASIVRFEGASKRPHLRARASNGGERNGSTV